MTKQERSDYMRKYRAEHKEQIKSSVSKRQEKKFLQDLDHIEQHGNVSRAIMKDGRTFDFVRPFSP